MSTPAPRKATPGVLPAAFILTDHADSWGVVIFLVSGTPTCVRSLLFSVSPCLSSRFCFSDHARSRRSCGTGTLACVRSLLSSASRGELLVLRSRCDSVDPVDPGDSPIGRGSQPDHARSPDLFHPTPPFLHLCCKHSTSSQSTLGSPLRDAWVALGPPKGHPIPDPIPIPG
jgi:hypothetical protein